MSDIWATIAAERGALGDDLTGLTAAQWETRSLCTQWSVRDIVAHMWSTASMSTARFFVGMAFAGPLLLAMAGRGAACDDLAGPGVQTLRSRCTAQ